VRDPKKEAYGKSVYWCARRECIFIWEGIPEAKWHWPYMLGLELNRSRGTWQKDVASCGHPLEELVAMGGRKPSLQCRLCGGRWERGPGGQRLVGSKERKKFLAATASHGFVEALGMFRRPTEEEAKPRRGGSSREEPSESQKLRKEVEELKKRRAEGSPPPRAVTKQASKKAKPMETSDIEDLQRWATKESADL